MSRKLSQVINDENYFEWIIPIGQSAVEYIIRGLQERYTARFTVRMEPNYIMDNLMTVSMFFDTQINRLYLTYKLDRDRLISVRAYDKELYNRIFDNLQSQLVNDYDIGLTIVGDPTSLREYSLGREYRGNGLNSLFIRNYAQYLWKIDNLVSDTKEKTSYTYFVENRSMFQDDLNKRMIKDSRDEHHEIVIPKDIMPEYIEKVKKINEKYKFYRNEIPGDPDDTIFRDYNAAFAEYQNIYNEYFDRIPENIPEWKGFTISINVDHDFDKEKGDYQDHPYGKFKNPDEVEHYIAKWAHDHGKYVPQEILDKWGLN